jgi:hypothetical protein
MVVFREARIRIFAVPATKPRSRSGEQWVGVIFPLVVGETGPSRLVTCGVISGTPGRNSIVGHVGEIEEAIRVLALKAPEAAACWRQNTPDLFAPGGTLVFDRAVCRAEGGL